jgi:flagellum-specific peptidoglycan hydrolase FlgJ
MNFDDEIRALAHIPLSYGLLASVLIAQSELETGHGKRFSAKNNCVGRKYKVKEDYGSSYTVSGTKEYLPEKDPEEDGEDGWKYLGDGWWTKGLAFKDYDTLEDCVHDYCKRLRYNKLYAAVAKAADEGDYEAYLDAVAAMWATDPRYRDKLVGIIEREGLRGYDGI